MDSYQSKLFPHWLIRRAPGEGKEWVRSILLQETMSEVLASLILSDDDKDIETFVVNWLIDGDGKEIVRRLLLLNCPSVIQIAVKAKYVNPAYVLDVMYTDSLLQRMSVWFTLQEVRQFAVQCLGSDDYFDEVIVSNIELSKFFSSIFSREELFSLVGSNERRVTDIAKYHIEKVRTCWGKQVCPKEFLKFKCKNGRGRSKGTRFVHCSTPKYLMDSIWDEISRNIDDAVEVTNNDGGFSFIRRLDKSMKWQDAKIIMPDISALGSDNDSLSSKDLKSRWAKKALDGFYSSVRGLKKKFATRQQVAPQLDSKQDSSEILPIRSRRKLVMDILINVDWKEFDTKGLENELDICYFIAYGKLESKERWEGFLEQLELKEHLSDILFRCLLLSALYEEEDEQLLQRVRTASALQMIRVPFESLRKFLETNAQKWIVLRPLISILVELSRNKLVTSLSSTATKVDHRLLTALPSVWEFLFLPGGLAYDENAGSILKEQIITKESSNEIVSSIISYAFYSVWLLNIPCHSVGAVLTGIMNAFGEGPGQEDFKEIMKSPTLLKRINELATEFWYTNADLATSYIGEIIGVYLNLFEGTWEWLNDLIDVIPAQLIAIGEGNGWMDLVRKVRQWAKKDFLGMFSIKMIYYDTRFRYNRSCDWYRLLKQLPKIKKRVPSNFEEQTEVYENWECCFLHVHIQVFGEECTKIETETRNTDQDLCFWESAAKTMRDGELLHIAVQLGSLRGVKATAWPGVLDWRDTKNGNKTALEFSVEKWGGEHDITKFLLSETRDIAASGFLQF